MVLNAIEVAGEIPNEGERSVENDVQSIEDICGGLIDDFRSAFADLRTSKPDLKLYKEQIREVKIALRNPKHASKDHLSIKKKFAVLNVDEEEMVLVKELGEALISTAEYLSFIDLAREKFGTVDDEYSRQKARLGAKANIEFGDFFIKLHQQFGLSSDDMESVLNKVFGRYELKDAFYIKDREQFPKGVYAFVGAYMALQATIKEEGKFRMPSVDEDVDYSFDLIWKSTHPEVPDRYYEIKAGAPELDFCLLDVHDSKTPEFIRTEVAKYSGQLYIDMVLESAEDIKKSIDERRETGEDCNGYLVIVPLSYKQEEEPHRRSNTNFVQFRF